MGKDFGRKEGRTHTQTDEGHFDSPPSAYVGWQSVAKRSHRSRELCGVEASARSVAMTLT